MAHQNLSAQVIELVQRIAVGPDGPPTAGAIAQHLKASRRTLNRVLARLVAEGQLGKTGAGPETRYRPLVTKQSIPSAGPVPAVGRSPEAAALLAKLSEPLGSRSPASYERAFVDEYVPNESALMPRALANILYAAGRAQGQQPAGTVARKVLEQLLIDLSWHSSRLEGNRISLLDTKELFEQGRGDSRDPDITMLLNHKEAIEFMVDAVPEQGMTVPIIRNLHALLMQGLLSGSGSV
ncbi:MAG: hypothetical protein WAM52_05965 [Steroidobacteraceae bacterium]